MGEGARTNRHAPHLTTQQPTKPPKQQSETGERGLGCDSSAILARWLTDPSSRDFALHELAVITGMTGQEWPATRQLVEQHLLPLMTTAGVRYLQIARRGPRQADGVDILSDTRAPDQLHLVGRWTLADEMFDSGTLPQTTGDRL